MNSEEEPYIAIGTKYYKRIEMPMSSGKTIKKLVPWTKEAIIQDHGRKKLNDIPRLNGFCCIPDHLKYQRIIHNCYNEYEELPFRPSFDYKNINELKRLIPNSLMFMEHIFGEQKEMGLDYIKILLEKPIQKLPILCLVSKERSTGKSTFIKWLRAIFGYNMTYIKGDSFSSAFNADWATKLLVAIDEVFFDKKDVTERLKYLSTTDRDKLEAKGIDRIEIEFFIKFILCSNNENDFIKIDLEETRYWVRKIASLTKEDINFFSKIQKEIPHFLAYLISRNYSTENKTRMWFTPEQLKTQALINLKNNNNPDLIILEQLHECFEKSDFEDIYIAPFDLEKMLKKQNYKSVIKAKEIRKILKKLGFKPEDNSKTYQGIELLSYGEYVQIDRKGRYYTINKTEFYNIYDALMQNVYK